MDKNKQEKQLRYLTQSERLREAEDPKLVRLTLFCVSLCIVGFAVWASVTNINEVARAPGEVVPQGFQQTVQHLEGGIVRALWVQDGDEVDAGQVIMSIDGAGAQEDLTRAYSHQAALALQRERLRAFIEGRKPDFDAFTGHASTLAIEDQREIFTSMITAREKEREIIESQVAQKQHTLSVLTARRGTIGRNLAITQDMYNRRKQLHDSGYVSHISYLETRREMNALRGERSELEAKIGEAEASLSEYSQRLSSLGARHRDEAYRQLESVENEMTQNRDLIGKLEDRVARLEIRAPVRGLIKGLSVNTVGAVVQPGQVLMEVIPLDKPLVVEARISPRHIGHLRPGQSVQVKVSSYDFSRYGAIPGTLDTISATTFVGEGGDRFYRGRIRLERLQVGNGNPVMPGMTVMADIITGRKTIMDYMMKPVRNSLQTAFSER